MKKSLMLLVAIIATVLSANAQYNYGSSSYGSSSYSTSSYGVNTNSTYVKGYTKSNGTYVHGHYRSSQNSTNHDNYSTSGNYNPYTGSAGSRAKDYSTGACNYGNGHTIHTGSRGGQYYINSNGNKTYVPKRR
ncbi:hypothetical protein [Duncaniella freteri]|uniref:hypothetical protein n=1 Tax=Duncaniella freteri TaxID=2530391 RepID=UPI002573A967|nr:hypothetical protein [Duncaniella freteri]